MYTKLYQNKKGSTFPAGFAHLLFQKADKTLINYSLEVYYHDTLSLSRHIQLHQSRYLVRQLGFVRSHENPALIYYIAFPEYIAQPFMDSCYSGNGVEKSLPVDYISTGARYIHSHIAQLHCNPSAAYSNWDDGCYVKSRNQSLIIKNVSWFLKQGYSEQSGT